ncbi:hypothetical protein [Streptomyces sp. NPDC001450]
MVSLVSGIVVFALGCTGGAAFLAIATLGMGVLGYLVPSNPSAG